MRDIPQCSSFGDADEGRRLLGIPLRQTYIWVHRSKHRIAIPHSKRYVCMYTHPHTHPHTDKHTQTQRDTYIPQPDAPTPPRCRLLSWAACGPWTDAGRLSVCLSTHTHTHTHSHTHVCVCVCVCVHTHSQVDRAARTSGALGFDISKTLQRDVLAGRARRFCPDPYRFAHTTDFKH